MTLGIDIDAARRFAATHARTLDRRRLLLLLGETDPSRVLDALEAYRNRDGGYGWGLEPDLRAVESQPCGALHAFEAMAEVAPLTTSRAVELCDWLTTASRPDGGLPFALPIADPAGCAPFWAGADHGTSSLHITAAVTAAALRVARHDPAVAAHPWLAGATDYCLRRIAGLDRPPHAYELMFSLQILDAAHDRSPGAQALLDRLLRFVPDDGVLPVEGGVEGERLQPLEVAPRSGPLRDRLRPDVVERDLRRIRAGQQADGGWTVDFSSYSPIASLEWRGYATVQAVSILLTAQPHVSPTH